MPPSNEATGDPKDDVALSALLSLIEDYHDFNPDSDVPVFPYPTDLQFSQQIARARPCVYHLDRDVFSKEAKTASFNAAPNGDSINFVDQDRTGSSLRGSQSADLDRDQRSILSSPCFGWTRRTICDILTEDVEIAVTPDGRADSLYSIPKQGQKGAPGETDRTLSSEHVFVQPATTHMTLSKLIDQLCPQESSSTSPDSRSRRRKPVYYLQSQDSNLSRPEMSPLLARLPATPPPFAYATLGDPEATNIWIGDERSVTSTHRDPYENLYLVVKGRKKFVLYAPVEEICLHAEMVRTGRWVRDGENEDFRIVMDGEDPSSQQTSADPVESDEALPRIPWIPIDPFDPSPPSSREFPYYKYARPVTVTVEEGEILYLPAGWFHHVTQECGHWEDDDGRMTRAPCIAINYWFDMNYDGEKHVMREMVRRLVERVRSKSMAAK